MYIYPIYDFMTFWQSTHIYVNIVHGLLSIKLNSKFCDRIINGLKVFVKLEQEIFVPRVSVKLRCLKHTFFNIDQN